MMFGSSETKEIGMIAPEMMDSPQYFGFPNVFVFTFSCGFVRGQKLTPPKPSYLEDSLDDSNESNI